jgi:hypothetical protein
VTRLVTVLSAGVDTLVASVPDGLTTERLAEALEHRGMAQDSAETAVWEIPATGHTFEVLPHGFRRYAACLKSPAMQLRVGPEDENRPAVVIEWRSAFLHQVGAEAAVEEAEQVAAYFCPVLGEGSEASPPPHLRLAAASAQMPGRGLTASRVDLYVDTQGWVPGHADFSRFVTWANHRRVLEEPRQLHQEGREVSGFTFGRGAVMCRIYNKTLQLKKKGETWPTELWAGMDPDQPVWRIEFQFRRAALKDFRLDGEPLHSVADVLAMRQALWEYGSEWLSLRVPTEDTNNSRWPAAPLWKEIQEVVIGSPCAELVRTRVREADEQRLLAGFCGYASSLAARGYGTRLSETLGRVQPAAEGYLRKKGRTFEKVTTHKRERVLDTIRKIADDMPWRARRAS